MSVADDLIMKLLYFLIILLECHFIISDNIDYSNNFKQFLNYQQEGINNEQKLLDNQKIILETQLDALDNRQNLLESQQSLLNNFVEFLDKQQGLVQPSVLSQNESTTIDHPGQFL